MIIFMLLCIGMLAVSMLFMSKRIGDNTAAINNSMRQLHMRISAIESADDK